jgi:hypothetical protein
MVQWRLNTKDLWHPHKAYNVDGTENQGEIISKSCVLRVRQGEQQIAQRFYVTNLGQDRVTIRRTCYHMCIHLAILRICDTRALDATDQDALMARYGLLFVGLVAFCLYDMCGVYE